MSNVPNTQQATAINWAINKKNFFLTGDAGTGKSFTIKQIFKIMRKKKKKIYITATTGIAANNIGGRTLHSWAGLGLADGKISSLLDILNKNPSKLNIWKKTQCLIIDEVSMLNEEFLVKLNTIAKKVRGNCLPFGGIQIIFVGDFAQLPPVYKDLEEGKLPPLPLFCTNVWKEIIGNSNKNIMCLEHKYRNQNYEFNQLLNKIRCGNIDKSAIEMFTRLEQNVLKPKFGVKPTILFTNNKLVDRYNTKELNNLEGKMVTIPAVDSIINIESKPDWMIKKIKESFAIGDVLKLKQGAQVMLLYNRDIPKGLVNGSRGVVEYINFDKDEKEIITITVRFLNGSVIEVDKQEFKVHFNGQHVGTRLSFPLKLAWAVTIHKSQGLSIDYLKVDLQKTFAAGQTYVALSRARTMEGLQIENFSSDSIKVDENVLKFYKLINNKETDNMEYKEFVNKIRKPYNLEEERVTKQRKISKYFT